ncbi:helix-turn-helix domain-containing protein [Thiomonas sp.]|uniref:helix-turn-helix domain-containing protein n=1 Tax=Thiomonas sp. TaxID=2047785 RepID=UPI002615A85D|nr:helix-turn-helix domain-containing protein [Thiomonas sp.]
MSNPPSSHLPPSASDGDEAELSARRQAGALLRAAREASGRSLSELATQLKVSADKISALEAGEWDRLHDPAHARGLLRAAAKAVRADADAVLRPLPPVFVRGTPIVPAPGVTMGPVRPAEPVGTHGSSRRLVWLGVLAVVVALGLLYLPRSERFGYLAQEFRALLTHRAAPVRSGVVVPLAASAAVVVAPASPAPSGPVQAVAASAPASAPGAPALSASGGDRASPVAAAGPAATPAQRASVPSASAPAPLVGPPGPLLQLSASAPSWVRVRSSQGRVLFSGLLAAGASRDVTTLRADFPLHLTVGNAAGTRVSLAGKPVAMQAGGDNVARFAVPGAAP